MAKMSRIAFIVIVSGFCLVSCMEKKSNYKSFDDYPVNSLAGLWLNYTPGYTEFALWSPPASEARVNLYEKGDGGAAYENVIMTRGKAGVWKIKIFGDLDGTYYTYQVKIGDKWLDETPGIYAQAVGVNGMRAMVLEMQKTNPDGWENDRGPQTKMPNQAILYELHIRDLTINPNSGSSKPGKYLGLVEAGTKGPGGVSTAIDHIKELGITHVHLLPTFDHYSIDETKLDTPQFNWGYDPQNYNVPEGSFSADPFNAEVRIGEFKQMVKAFHDNGIGVILDVVYNHTGRTEESNFNQEVPGYYYRHNKDGSYSNASGCGNETASERAMMRKFIVESVKYWAQEYHIDGFRFDLMGIHDIETMNRIATAVKKINPSAIVYGEGWTGGASPLPEDLRAVKKNTRFMKNVSAFSDDMRDGIKGSVFETKSTGFISGAKKLEESIKFGVIGAIYHEQIIYPTVNYSDTVWAEQPWQSVSYVSCHDNNTLFDKLSLSRPKASKADIRAMHKLANAIVLTGQGIPFLHAGVEMMRTKGGEHNSYNLPDSVNQIDWNWKVENKDVFDYYKALIALRRNHSSFWLPSADAVRKHLRFMETQPGLVGYTISGFTNGDSWKEVLVVYNANPKARNIAIEGEWNIAALGSEINEQGIKKVSGSVDVPGISMLVAYR